MSTEYRVLPPEFAPRDRAGQIECFKRNGLVVLPDLLTGGEVAAINAAIDRDRAEHPYLWWFEGNPRCGCNLLLTQPAVEVCLRPPAVMEILTEVMGPDFVFEEMAVQITEPSREARPTGWHRDRDHWMEHPYRLDYPQIIYYLTDVDETTHCFTISPESPDQPVLDRDAQIARDGAYYFHAKAGGAILFNCALFHGLTARATESQRRIVQVYYGHPEREPINNATMSPPRLWRDHPDPETRRFFGKLNGMTRTMYAALGISADDAAPFRE
jgi:hypothetical protein